MSKRASGDGAVLAAIDRALAEAATGRAALMKRLADIASEKAELEASGAVERGSIYMREGRFAYLHVSQPGGGRTRSYIGVDPQAIEEAREAIKRGERLTALRKIQDQLRVELWEWLRRLEDVATSVPGNRPRRRW